MKCSNGSMISRSSNGRHVIPKMAQRSLLHQVTLQTTIPREVKVFFVADRDLSSLFQGQTTNCTITWLITGSQFISKFLIN